MPLAIINAKGMRVSVQMRNGFAVSLKFDSERTQIIVKRRREVGLG